MSITIPAGSSHALQRGGDHIMMMGTPQPLADGDPVALTLDFGTCGTLALTAAVDNQAGQPGTGDAGHAAFLVRACQRGELLGDLLQALGLGGLYVLIGVYGREPYVQDGAVMGNGC